MDDLLTLVEFAKRRLCCDDQTLDRPILVQCLDCGKEWYSQHPVIQCEVCASSLVCTPVAACRSCYRSIVNITAVGRCEHCGSQDIAREGTPEFPYMNDAEWERKCREQEQLT